MYPADKFRVLIVDDEVDLLSILKPQFLRQGFEVATSDSAGKALKLMKSEAPFHALLTDIQMPQFSGLEFISRIKEMFSDPPIPFLMTGFSGATDEELKETGAHCLFHKPFSTAKTVKCILDDLKSNFHGDLFRQFSRFKARDQVEIFHQDSSLAATSVDMGRGGVFIELDKPLKIDSEVELKLSLGGKFYRTKARVVWNRIVPTGANLRGSGMVFLERPSEFDLALRAILE